MERKDSRHVGNKGQGYGRRRMTAKRGAERAILEHGERRRQRT